MTQEPLPNQINEFMDIYIHDSSIEFLTYDNKLKKWIIQYNYATENDHFDSFQDMLDFLQADQFGGD